MLISVDIAKMRNGHFFYGLHNCEEKCNPIGKRGGRTNDDAECSPL